MHHEAKFWRPLDNQQVRCLLCPHQCTIPSGRRGICGVRENKQGKLISLIYGSCSSIADDPIEKKPLYHFYPGSLVLSLGSVGCTMKCAHCQNASISTAQPYHFPFRELTPEQTVAIAQEHNCRGIAWTYNEPTIWHEYAYDTMKYAKRQGLATVYVTNGYINEDPLRELSPYLDAMNIDVKAFTESFYHKICTARLEPVLNTCELAKNLGIHVELTYLVIPGYNDTLDEINKFCRWVLEKLGRETPVHFTRFHPDHQMTNLPATPKETMITIYSHAQNQGLLYAYLGNIAHGSYENTRCPICHKTVIERHGFSIQLTGVNNKRCMYCGTILPIISD
ncbi:MAG: AmmeMemoRadiSam system radical SAM enzyme [Candidatus Thermoplasmatota archaeon]